MQATLDAHALGKLRWRCRRGLLENDLFLERFFTRHGAQLHEQQARALLQLMDLSDNDLLDLLLGRVEPTGELLCDDVVQVLHMLRAPASAPAPQARTELGSGTAKVFG